MNLTGLKFDDDFHPIEPTAILTTRSGKKIGLIPKTEFRYKGNLSSADEISFTVHRNAASDDVWNGLKDFRLCWIRELDAYFEIAVTVENSDGLVKKVTGVSLGEAELSQTNLYGVEINTEKEITNDVNYSPTVFYNESNENRSLMHRLLKGTCYNPGYVDECLRREQRSFSFNNTSIKDGFDEVARELKCLFIYRIDTDAETGKINRVVDAYNLDEERKNPDGFSAPVYGNDTGIFISDENIARRITLTTDTGSVKNCFKLEGGDDAMTAAIASVNPTGASYLWYISDDMKATMSDELRTALDEYADKYDKITNSEIVVGKAVLANMIYYAYKGVIENVAGSDYDTSEHGYSVGDRAKYNGSAYRCKSTVEEDESWSDEKWEYVYGEHNAIFSIPKTKTITYYDFSNSASYHVGDIVRINTKPSSRQIFWDVLVYECVHDYCYGDIQAPKAENHPANFPDYWRERVDLEFIDPFDIKDSDYSYTQNISQLSEYIYNAIDVRLFITDTMMPDYNIVEMNQSYADSTAGAIQDWFEDTNNKIGATNEDFSVYTDDMAKRAADGMIKTIADSRFNIDVSNVLLTEEEPDTYKKYTGSVSISGVDKDGDNVSAECNITITVYKGSDSYQKFIEQKIDKALAKKTESFERVALNDLKKYKGVYSGEDSYENGDVVWYDQGMYKCISESTVTGGDTPDEDKAKWEPAKIGLYSVSELQNLYDCCDGCLAVLVEQGATGSSQTAADDFYGKYRNVMQGVLRQKEFRQDQVRAVRLYTALLRRILNNIHNELNMETALGDNMDELISYRRDSVYSNSNFISDGLTNHELMKRAALFFEDAVKEIYKSAERQHSISSDIYNLLAIKEFESVRDQFVLGNWIREKLDGEVYKLRLIGYEINFADLTTLTVEFSDLLRAGDSVSDVKSILDRAKSVSSTYGFTARQADRGGSAKEELDGINKNGINVGDVSVFGNDKSIQWTQGGFILREYDDLTDTYSPNQLKFLATGIYKTTDNWETVIKVI